MCLSNFKAIRQFKVPSRGFETSRDLTKRRLFGYWDGALMAFHIRAMDDPGTTAAHLRVTVQQASVARGELVLGIWYGECHVECVLSWLPVVVTSTINQPSTMPLMPSTDFRNFENFQCQIFLLRSLFFDTCYSGTNDTTAHCLHLPGPRFNIKMPSYQYMKSHCGDKTVVKSSYLHNGISSTGKMTSFYWIRAQEIIHIGVATAGFVIFGIGIRLSSDD